jgi:hypothetical protein
MFFKQPSDVFDGKYLADEYYVWKKQTVANLADSAVLSHITNYVTWTDIGPQNGKYGFLNLMKSPHLFKNKVAVEIDSSYSAADNRIDWVRINMSGQDFIKTLQPTYGTISLFDVIEHLPKDEAISLLKECEKKAEFVILFTPDGFDEGQNHYAFTDEHPTEKHLCGFTEEDFRQLGYTTILLTDFHKDKKTREGHTEQENLNAILAFKRISHG